MTFKLGLTGSIGMGKSTTASMFAEHGCALWDADAAVHRLYDRGGAAVDPIGKIFPQAVKDGSVMRTILRDIISVDPEALQTIEKIVHPLVAQDRAAFSASVMADILVLDIPLLFETNGQAAVDAVAVVHAPQDIQSARVLARSTMTLQQFEAIKSKQMPSDEKCALADFVILTDSLEHARMQVKNVVERIRRKIANA